MSDSYAKNDEKHGVADTARATLTDAEREAIAWFSQLSYGEGGRVPTYAATLRNLLERLA
jgi:hypothetical protein